MKDASLKASWNDSIRILAKTLELPGALQHDVRFFENKSIERLSKTKPFVFLLISGPSGVGKGTIEKAIMEGRPGMPRLLNVTTRPPRPGEVDGVDYHFVNQKRFDLLDKQGALLQTQVTHGSSHGLLRDDFFSLVRGGRMFLVDKSISSTRKLLVLDEVSQLNYLTVFLLPPSFEILENRLRNRNISEGDAISEEWIMKRLARAIEEVQESAGLYDIYLVNDDIERACGVIEQLI